MRHIVSVVLISMLSLLGVAQESSSSIGKLVAEEGARSLIENYKSFYNDKGYIEDGHANYNIVGELFTTDIDLKNDFSSGRSNKISIKDYIKFLSEHYSFGVQVKLVNIQLLSEVKTSNETTIVLAYNKHIFGHYDNELVVSKVHQERLTLFKNTAGKWQISKIDILVPPFISIDLSGSVFNPGFSLSQGENRTEMAGYKQEDQISTSYGVLFEFNVINALGVGLGFNYATYKTSLSAVSVTQDAITSIDKDYEPYTLYSDASGIIDDIELVYYNIPITLKYYFMTDKKFSPFVGLGGTLHISGSARSSMSGVSTQEGYYSHYHVLLYDIPELGFLTNHSFSRSNDLNVNSNYLSGELYGGARIQLYKDKVYGVIGAFYSLGFNSIIENKVYYLSRTSQEYNSLLYTNESVKLNNYGINIGLKFKIN